MPPSGSLFVAYRFYIVYRQSPLGPVDPSFRALSGRPKFTVRRHNFSKDSSLLTLVIYEPHHLTNLLLSERERILIQLMTSDRTIKTPYRARNEGSTGLETQRNGGR